MTPIILGRSVLALFALIGVSAMAAAPTLYRLPAFESPVRGDADDLVLLAGYGLDESDAVIYRAIPDGIFAPSGPESVPARSDALSGTAPTVSRAGVPYTLTVKLPTDVRRDRVYALWVRNAAGEWSRPVTINDMRPLWFTPAYLYASAVPAFLPREVKIVGRNLDSSPGRGIRVRLQGPVTTIRPALAVGTGTGVLGQYAVRVRLPPQVPPGRYRISLSRAGGGWVDVPEQILEILSDPRPGARFSVDDPMFGGCRPDDGADDTSCIVRAIEAAARAGGGIVRFGPGTWDLVDNAFLSNPGDGIVVPPGVELKGAGAPLTRLRRHPSWNSRGPSAAFTLESRTRVSGFTFSDLQKYRPDDRSGPMLRIGKEWQHVRDEGDAPVHGVEDLIVARNVFDKPQVAIAAGGLPIRRLFITYNVFGAYDTALQLNGDQFNVRVPYRLDDSVIDFNVFKPGSKLDIARKTGSLASEIGAGLRLDFSGNAADGAATEYLYAPDDARGWRAAFFWNPNGNVEEVLISQNVATCTGDKIGDGEAIALDNNTNAFAFASAPAVARAGEDTVMVSELPVARQHAQEVPIDSYYVGHWVRVVSGPGLGQVRKITGYTIDPVASTTTFRIAPKWDVTPMAARSRIIVGREYWQVYVLENRIDNRRPLCRKSNRSRPSAGEIVFWAEGADSVIAGNRQYDSDGILIHQSYVTPQHACADCTMQGYFHSFLDVRDNVIDGEYDAGTDCSTSGITADVAAAPWEGSAPPTVGFGVSISHNVIRAADALRGGAISQVTSWWAGPEPHRWPLSDNLLIHHNAISDLDGSPATANCAASRARTGIAFPDAPVAWRTVLYANSCRNVPVPVGDGAVDAVRVCPSSVSDSCECTAVSR